MSAVMRQEFSVLSVGRVLRTPARCAYFLIMPERLDEAEAEYQVAAEALPDEGVPRSNIANLLARRNHLPRAIDQFRAALDVNPNDNYAHTGLGIALARQGNLDSAKDEFDLVLATEPDNEDARTSLAHVFQDKRQWGRAISEYELALAAHPDSALAHNNLADIYATSPDPQFRNFAAALEHAKRAVELSKSNSPTDQRATFLGTLAEALRINGRSDEVIPTLRQAVAIDPTSASAHRRLARALELTRDDAGAISEYEQEVRFQSDLASAQNGVDLCHLQGRALQKSHGCPTTRQSRGGAIDCGFLGGRKSGLPRHSGRGFADQPKISGSP